ncbi:nuclear transport factor 2 family protein [Mangrovivirga sp. M17]|uniref:Nuclear transport factor 2 family protein n=1 Tax=Mangrovivirga halotolerans TaxID=2993936 RepID=A0ABT3RQU0_9BACT|nr:nuclear transport factor 2 family protein [Mangrovivirga halotolerans]MCX2744143.1 nuclear transport factor 2 family protein [Mangrovivirga halotolerans]
MTPKEVVLAWVKAFNEGDAEKLANLYHDDAINHQGANKPVKGKNAIKKMFEEEFDRLSFLSLHNRSIPEKGLF